METLPMRNMEKEWSRSENREFNFGHVWQLVFMKKTVSNQDMRISRPEDLAVLENPERSSYFNGDRKFASV